MVFTSSSVGRQGRAYWGAYAVSKFALEGLSQVLAQELEGISHVRVNTLNPGRTRTAMRRQAYPAEDLETLPAAGEPCERLHRAAGTGKPRPHGPVLRRSAARGRVCAGDERSQLLLSELAKAPAPQGAFERERARGACAARG